jgi:competence ComEA-like helix-hairpin-helix protein
MQSSNSFNYSIYTLLFNVTRLTFLAICLLLCFLLPACTNSSQNQQLITQKQELKSENAVNLNLASAEELEKLPKIGKTIARRIIEYREKYGKFRRAENLILVRGMSDKKFREIQTLITVE